MSDDTKVLEPTFTDKNGAIHDTKTGKIIKASPTAIFDSKRGREMALRRAELMKQNTRKGVEAGVLRALQKRDPTISIESIKFPTAHQEVIATLTEEVVMNPRESGKGRADTYMGILQVEGSLGNIRKPDMGSDQKGITIHISEAVAQHVIEATMRNRQKSADIIDVTAVEIDGPGSDD